MIEFCNMLSAKYNEFIIEVQPSFLKLEKFYFEKCFLF